MAQDPSLFDQFALSINGALSMVVQSLSVQCEGKDVDVETIFGWAGITPGPKSLMIDVKSAIPNTGFDFDAFDNFINSTLCAVTVQSLQTGKILNCKGFTRDPNMKTGVGENSELTFKFKTTPSTFS